MDTPENRYLTEIDDTQLKKKRMGKEDRRLPALHGTKIKGICSSSISVDAIGNAITVIRL